MAIRYYKFRGIFRRIRFRKQSSSYCWFNGCICSFDTDNKKPDSTSSRMDIYLNFSLFGGLNMPFSFIPQCISEKLYWLPIGLDWEFLFSYICYCNNFYSCICYSYDNSSLLYMEARLYKIIDQWIIETS
jgi:hypothetical protein